MRSQEALWGILQCYQPVWTAWSGFCAILPVVGEELGTEHGEKKLNDTKQNDVVLSFMMITKIFELRYYK